MFAPKIVQHHKLIYTCGIVVDNIQTDDKLNSYLQIKTQHNIYVWVLYNSEFPPSENIAAGDVAFNLQIGDEVEMMAEIVNDDFLSICANEHCAITKSCYEYNN